MATTANELFETLAGAPLFSKLGAALSTSMKVTPVSSWTEALEWTEHPVSWWCNVEAKKVLYENLAKTHYARFAQWGNIARLMLPRIQHIVEKSMLPQVPPDVPLSDKSRDWIQSQVVGAVMELSYADCFPVQLFQSHIDLYLQGHFPCGWHVTRPEEFPHNASIIVY